MDRRSGGKASVGGAVWVVVIVVSLYFAFMYLPVLSHKMKAGDIVREAASKMIVELDDRKIREQIDQRCRAAGLVVGPSDVVLKRQTSPIVMTVSIKWTEQVKHLWGKNHVLKMQASASASPGGLIKNAD